MPGSIQFSYPRPYDPSLEFQPDRICFVVDCDSQHAILCGNRGTKVSVDTSGGLSTIRQASYDPTGKLCTEPFWRGDEVAETIIRLRD